MYYLGATHNVFKFLEVGIMAEGGDDSAQDTISLLIGMCISANNSIQYCAENRSLINFTEHSLHDGELGASKE